MQDLLTKWALEQIQKRGFEAVLLWSLVFLAVGVALGFFIGQFWQICKTKREADSVELENKKKMAELLEQLDIVRQKWHSAKDTLNLHFRNVASLAPPNLDQNKLKMYREEMCRCYDNEYLPAFQSYLEKIPTLTYPQEARLRAVGEIIPGLQTMVSFLKMANEPNILKEIQNATPFLLNPTARDTILSRTNALLSMTNIQAKWRLFMVWFATNKYLRK